APRPTLPAPTTTTRFLLVMAELCWKLESMPTPSGRVLITGAGIRVGRALALAFAEAGYDLLLHANASRTALEEVVAAARAMGRRAWAFTADLARDGEVDRFAREVAAATPALDVLVHNAGIYEQVPFREIDRARYRRMQA